MSVNSVVFSGNLARDAELKTVGDTSVVEFSMGHTPYRSETTMWFRVHVWGKYGEALHSDLAKGAKVTVAGRLSMREYEKDGETRQSWEIRADQVDIAKAAAAREDAPSSGSDDDDGGFGLPV